LRGGGTISQRGQARRGGRGGLSGGPVRKLGGGKKCQSISVEGIGNDLKEKKRKQLAHDPFASVPKKGSRLESKKKEKGGRHSHRLGERIASAC